ncbi:MAG TPA: hypothetical protein VMJ13_04630 [Candidatus Acidoferrum sp.]|jgi:hypothetical protein|nr:hypothetical protein [Candidatus Acidoferrum sp.]
MKEPHIIVQFVGFQSKNSVREYTFTVREPSTEPREYTIAIPNEAFDSRRARYQDAPDICSHKLHRELAAAENHPQNSHFRLTNAELDDYRTTHMPKQPKYPYTPKPAEEDT